MAVEQVRVYEIAIAASTGLQNNEICNETVNDSDLGFKMWCGKDNSGGVTKWLAKNQSAFVSTLRVTSFTTAGFVKNDANGDLIGGNVVLMEDIPDRYWNRHASGWIYPRTLTDTVGIKIALPTADLHVNGTFRTEVGTSINTISTDGTFITPAVTDDMLSTSLAIKTYVDAQLTGATPWTRDATDSYLYPTTTGDKVSISATATHVYTHQVNITSDTNDCLRICGGDDYTSGGKINFGDADYVAIEEADDDELTVRASTVYTKAGNNSFAVETSGTTANIDGGTHNFSVYDNTASAMFECNATDGKVYVLNGTGINNINVDGSFIAPAVTDDMLSTSLAIKTYVDSKQSPWTRDATNNFLYPATTGDKVSLSNDSTYYYTHTLNIRNFSDNKCLRITGTGASGEYGRINFGPDDNNVALEESYNNILTMRGLVGGRVKCGSNEMSVYATVTYFNELYEDINTIFFAEGSGHILFMDSEDATISLNTGTSINEFSIDGTLYGNSDDAVPTEKAVKTYVDNASVASPWTDNGSYIRQATQGRKVNIAEATSFVTTHMLSVSGSTSNSLIRMIGTGTSGSGGILNWGDGDYVHISEPSDDYMQIKAINGIYFQPGSSGTNTSFMNSSADFGVGLILGISSRLHVYEDNSVSMGKVVTVEHNGTGATIAFEDSSTLRGYIGCKACSGADSDSMGICAASDVIQFGGGGAGVMMTIDDDNFRFGDGNSPSDPIEFNLATRDWHVINAGTDVEVLTSGYYVNSFHSHLIKVKIGGTTQWIKTYGENPG